MVGLEVDGFGGGDTEVEDYSVMAAVKMLSLSETRRSTF